MSLAHLVGDLWVLRWALRSQNRQVPTAASETRISRGITLVASSVLVVVKRRKTGQLTKTFCRTRIRLVSHTKIRLNNNFLLSSMRSQVSKQKAHHFKVFKTIEDDSHLLDLLVIATSPAQQAFFIASVIKSLPSAFSESGHSKEPESLFPIFTAWFGQYKPESNEKFSLIATALRLRRQYFIENRFQKRHFIHTIGLDWDPATNQSFYSTVETISLSKLVTPYPPKHHWMVESSAIDNQWRFYIEEGKQPDKRHPRYPLFHVDPSRLQRDISSTEDLLIFDNETGQLVMLVLRQFCQYTPLLTHLGDVIKRAVQSRRSMRVCFIVNLFTS